MTEPNHGTVSGYTNGRCRCSECRAAMSDYIRANRARKRSTRQMLGGRLYAVDATEHGTAATYKNYGCRCVSCTVAAREYQRSYTAGAS